MKNFRSCCILSGLIFISLVLLSGTILAHNNEMADSHNRVKENVFGTIPSPKTPDVPTHPVYRIAINPIGTHAVNEEFYVTGTTNLPVEKICSGETISKH